MNKVSKLILGRDFNVQELVDCVCEKTEMLELARYAQSDDSYSVLELINVLNLSRSDVNPCQPQLLILDSDGQFESYLANLCAARG